MDIKSNEATIRLRWLTRGSEYQVTLGGRVLHRADTVEQAKNWCYANGYLFRLGAHVAIVDAAGSGI